MKLLIPSQTSTITQLKFGNKQVILSDNLLGMWLLVYTGIKVNPYQWKRSHTTMDIDPQ